MTRKQKIMVSITGITIVILALLGITYAYYLTRIQGNTNVNSVSITTANLKLTYRDGTGEIIADNVMPGNEIASKTFTVENNGNDDIEEYTVALINIINNFKFKEDLQVSVSCSSNINNGICEEFALNYEDNVYVTRFPSVNSELFSIGIKKGEIHSYTLIVDYLFQDFDQSDDMGKTLKGKVQIYDPKDTIELSGEVDGYADGDYAEIHSEVQTSEIIDGKYKFIGIPSDNHVVFIKNRKTNDDVSTPLEIKKGSEVKIDTNTIIFTDKFDTASVDIVKNNTNISTSINSVGKTNKTLVDTIMRDKRIIKNYGIPDFLNIADYKITGDSTSGEIGMYKAEDDYGVSWYFRGHQSYNYVNFAGFIWRIIRINGDGSIRMILNGNLATTKRAGLNVYAGVNSYFNEISNDNAYIGYMYGDFDGNSTNYDEAHDNINDSTIKKEVDKFYETYIENDSNNYHYGKYLSDTIFCGEKTNNLNCFGQNVCWSYRGGYYSSETPMLFCAQNHNNNYSRYTVDEYITTKGVETNGDLKYPIALITGDEIIMAGAKYGNRSYSNYLDAGYGWTMSPQSAQFYTGFEASVLLSSNVSSYPLWGNSVRNQQTGVRPVINLKRDILVDDGNGTQENPYTVKLAS